MASWEEYLTEPRESLSVRLCRCTEELASLHQELATVRTGYHQARIQGFWESPEPTVTGREREAERFAASNRVAVYDVEGQIAAVETERSLLLWILEENQ